MSTRTRIAVAVAAASAVVVAAAFFVLGEGPDGGRGIVDNTSGAGGNGPGVRMETIVGDLGQAWGTAFLPDSGDLLVTQVTGSLSLVDTENGGTTEVDGTPEVTAEGQGGLLDVAVDPEYPEQPWIYLTYSAEDGEGTTSTHVGRGQFDADEGTLQDFEELFTGEPGTSTEHFGSVLAFDADDKLVATFGDRGSKEFDDHPSQDTSNTLGTTVRLERDGSVPGDNPFVDDDGVADEIFTHGHRNAQGIAVQPGTDRIWLSEHGEQEGDSLRTIEGGQNHGWPVAHTGCEYGTDVPVGDDPFEREDVEAPVHHWECGSDGFPPAGMAFYEGEEFPAWDGDLLVAGLGQQYLARFSVDGTGVEEAEELLTDEGLRVRDVAVGPHDGAVYVAFDDEGAPLVKLTADE
ncbi:PQQ-dependent sugar dehydrogenase [Nocardiopsis xinjiangensis]|uniref:PQQ-dependent sugar dehydrogenase n=1 Tax=Nocardiopsis xinjiangensis TaxID=124285 RepID=UPI00034A270A|nr:PQQ-dependent sugar dehydrogenase [Nocardiopsis xinjiangensis]